MHPSAVALIDDLVAGVRLHFGERLVGIYLYGSLLAGDFDPGTSDIDLTALLTEDANDDDLESLRKLHANLIRKYPEWDDRVEVQYVAQTAVWWFRERHSPMINISPGEPIHHNEMGIEWLTNWYFIQDYGEVLFGAPIADVFPLIAETEFVEAVRDHARWWIDHLDDLDRSQAQGYAIMTLLRALYTHRTGKQVSKIEAAEAGIAWFPEWREAIEDALRWRIEPSFQSPQTAERARQTVRGVVRTIDRETTAPPGA